MSQSIYTSLLCIHKRYSSPSLSVYTTLYQEYLYLLAYVHLFYAKSFIYNIRPIYRVYGIVSSSYSTYLSHTSTIVHISTYEYLCFLGELLIENLVQQYIHSKVSLPVISLIKVVHLWKKIISIHNKYAILELI